MRYCTRCGHELGEGRFCTNCGEPTAQHAGQPTAQQAEDYTDWRTDTTERPVVLPPPPAAPPPPDPAAPEPTRQRRTHSTRERRSSPVPVALLLGLVTLLVFGALGSWLLFGGGDDTAPSADHPRRAPATTPAPTPTPTSTPTPSETPSDTSDTPTAVDLTRELTVEAPKPAPSSTDESGNPVSYSAAQMADGVPETCWRTPGDATGATITLTLPSRSAVSQVGLVNGYAKSARDARGELDWYHGNRRILRVTWAFDDGTTIEQTLDDTTAMQTVKVDGARTRTISMTLDEVSRPGSGRAARNYTAISDVSVVGTAG